MTPRAPSGPASAGAGDGKRPPPVVVLLGQQRFSETLVETFKAEGLDGQVALITCGWQEREDNEDDLRQHLGLPAVNLRLYHRARQVFDEDEPLRLAHRQRQQILRHKQDFYRIRLEHELDANHVIRQRHAPEEVLDEEEHASLASIRALDRYHLQQCERAHRAFDDAQQVHERPAVKVHRDEIATILGECSAVCIAGGHVASMLNRFDHFGIRELLDGQALFGWSAGAMVLTERIVLFHDSPPQGPGAAEVMDHGLGLVPGVVALPSPEERLRLDDSERVSVLAGRFAPARCLALPGGSHVRFKDGKLQDAKDVQELQTDGTVVPFEGGEVVSLADAAAAGVGS